MQSVATPGASVSSRVPPIERLSTDSLILALASRVASERGSGDRLCTIGHRLLQYSQSPDNSPILRPYVQRKQYRFIKLLDYSHFLLLCATVADSPHLAGLIESLEFKFGTWSVRQDFQVEQEESVYNFFKAADSLEHVSGLMDYPLLQRRMLSAKYALNCYKSLRSLEISLWVQQGSETVQAQAQYLCYFETVKHLIVIILDWTGPMRSFSQEMNDEFYEMDSDEIERSGRGQYYHAHILSTLLTTALDFSSTIVIPKLLLAGVPFKDDAAFVKDFRHLADFYASIDHTVDCLPALNAINYRTLRHLSLAQVGDNKTNEPNVRGEHIKRFVNLETLQLDGHAFDEEMIKTLTNFRKLSKIEFKGTSYPKSAPFRILLDPSTRPPALASLHLDPPVAWRRGNLGTGQTYIRPEWCKTWTAIRAQKIVALAQKEGITLGVGDEWEHQVSRKEKLWYEMPDDPFVYE